MGIRARVVATAATAVFAGLGVVATALPAAAATTPKGNNSSNEDVLLVHGYDPLWEAKFDCNDYFKDIRKDLKDYRWKGKVRGVAFYKGDWNCDFRIASGDRDTGLKDLGKKLANKIYKDYTAKGKSVDLVGHSMGGLIIRAALTGVAKKEAGFPKKLFVEDVVTLGTPHAGTNWGWGHSYQQTKDMRKNSSLIKWLKNNPQSTQPTDWTAIGSDSDAIVSESSATAGGFKHWVRYDDLPGKDDHAALKSVRTGLHKLKYRNSPSAATGWKTAGSPAPWTTSALFHYTKW
ncbi:esterase/lipase family protein [Streptomyces sp. HMX87]|uniref:esterase/lipase family protein n=1 Tax=Streptomyces sp. HMX87 TaxID=3390849 RepID=UPI003A8ACC98